MAHTKSVDSTFEATASLTPELVVALCGPIGSPLHETATQIKNALNEFGYRTEPIRLSELIRINTVFVVFLSIKQPDTQKSTPLLRPVMS